MDTNIPYGYCSCGCGCKTTISEYTDRRAGAVRGEPRRYVRGHYQKNNSPDYTIEERGYDTPCWTWQKSATPLGYGYKWDGELRKKVMAHRYYYEQAHGPIPAGLVLDHLCRVSRCVNPEHLEAVSHRENIRRGSHTKITQAQVIEMRERYRSGGITHTQLASDYGLHPVYVGRLLRGS